MGGSIDMNVGAFLKGLVLQLFPIYTVFHFDLTCTTL